MLVTTVKICGCRMLTTRIASARIPMMTAGSTGVWNRGWTLASRDAAGRLLSRAIAKASRIAAVCTARAQTVTAISTHHSIALPAVEPSTSRTTYCRPSVVNCSPVRLETLISASSRMSPPRANEATRARRIARGALREGSRDSSPSDAAVSKPYMTYAEASDGDEEHAEVAERLARTGALVSVTTCGPRVMLTASSTIRTTVARSSMNTPAVLMLAISFTPKALTRVVNRMSTAARITAFVATSYVPRAVAHELEERGDLRKRQLIGQRHGGDRHDRGDQHHPAGEPAECGLPSFFDQL